MKTASAYSRKGKILIQAFAKTTAGVWIAYGPVFTIEQTEINDLGIKVLKALNSSSEDIPHPKHTELQAIQKPMLEAAGVKSWSTFSKGAKAVGLTWKDDLITLEPCANYANQGGTPLPEKSISCKPTAEKLGAALIEAFNNCIL
ncbi:MAG: hypothetical protein V4525_08000 [Pseudomonadota bacterium]